MEWADEFYTTLALIGKNALLPLKFHNTKREEQLVNYLKPCKGKGVSVGDILVCQKGLMGS